MWDKILAAIMWLLSHPEVPGKVGGWVATVTGGVTNIKRWVNKTDQVLEVYKYDHGTMTPLKDRYTIPAGQELKGDMWIPYADDAAGYTSGRRAVLKLGGNPIAYLWQNGPLVRWNIADQFVPAGLGAPGEPRAGGDRSLVVATEPSGNIGFAIGKFEG
jgi:hypothetical protein